jgi:hypothetical protein
MKFGFKIHLDDIAEKLVESGLTSKDIDSDDLTNRVIEILQDEYDFFTALEETLKLFQELKQSMMNLSGSFKNEYPRI